MTDDLRLHDVHVTSLKYTCIVHVLCCTEFWTLCKLMCLLTLRLGQTKCHWWRYMVTEEISRSRYDMLDEWCNDICLSLSLGHGDTPYLSRLMNVLSNVSLSIMSFRQIANHQWCLMHVCIHGLNGKPLWCRDMETVTALHRISTPLPVASKCCEIL